MVLAVFPKSFTIGTETHVSVNVRFHRKRIGFVLAFGSSLVLGAIYLCLGCGVGFLGAKVLGLWFSCLGILGLFCLEQNEHGDKTNGIHFIHTIFINISLLL